MTSEHVSSFVTDLVEMAKAMERVPQLESQRDALTETINGLELRNSDLEVSLEASRRYAAGLEQKVHDLEVANTAIELRFLECDDAKGTLVRFLEGLIGDTKGVLAAVAPVPSTVNERIGEAVAIALDHGAGHVEVGESAADPTSSATTHTHTTMAESVEPQNVSNAESAVSGEGVSVPSYPTLASTKTAETPSPTVSVNETVIASDTASGAHDAPSRPYTGKRYVEVPEIVSLPNWLAGGGTEEDFYTERPWALPAH